MTRKTQSIIPKWVVRVGVLEVAIGWYLYVYLTTLLLSAVHQLDRASVIAAQAIFVTATLATLVHRIRMPRSIPPASRAPAVPSSGGIAPSKSRATHSWRGRTDFESHVIVVCILALVLFAQGFFSAPNTTDSMVYHLPRIMHWIQARSVFQTTILNDHDFLGPFGEYIMLHLYLLTNSDRLAFLSQWIAFVGVIVASRRIADRLGVPASLSGVATLLVATVPMAVMQAASTQVDLLTTFLFLVALVFALRCHDQPPRSSAFILSTSVGLGILAKATMFIFGLVPTSIAAPALLAAAVRQRAISYVLIPAAMLGMTLGPFVAQNEVLYGSPLGEHRTPSGVLIYTNETFSLGSIVSNCVRNVLTQLPVPVLSGSFESALIGLHHLIGIDMNDARTTWYGEQFHVQSVLNPQEDLVANPLQVLLIAASGVMLAVSRRRAQRLVIALYVLVIVAFVVFSAVFKWQPWHSRLLLPLLILGTLLSCVVLRSAPRMLIGVAIISTGLAVGLITFNVSRPLISYRPFASVVQQFMVTEVALPASIFTKPRFDQYFNARPYWEGPYVGMAHLVANDGASSIGIELMDGFEYPLWVAVQREMPSVALFPAQTGRFDGMIYTARAPRGEPGETCIPAPRPNTYACYVPGR
jgi:hypothetical protein